MEDTLHAILAYLERGEGFWAYMVLAACAVIEYIFPPFPGDTVTLFGTFLAITAGYQPVLVYVAITSGSVVGGVVAYAFGTWMGARQSRWPKVLQREKVRRTLVTVQERFARHGPAYLALNRFVPAFRAFFFVAAGLSGMPLKVVILYGSISAAVWNGILFGIGFALGSQWERLLGWSRHYTLASLAVLGVLALALGLRWMYRRKTGAR